MKTFDWKSKLKAASRRSDAILAPAEPVIVQPSSYSVIWTRADTKEVTPIAFGLCRRDAEVAALAMKHRPLHEGGDVVIFEASIREEKYG